jgi:hypothetical protein
MSLEDGRNGQSTEALDQEQPKRPSPNDDVSTRDGLSTRILRGSVVAALVAGALGAIVGYTVSGPGLGVGLGVAFALSIGALWGFGPTESEDGSIARAVNEGSNGDEP